MAQEIEAVFENGVLRPVTPLPLDEHERVTLQIARKCEEDWLDKEFVTTLGQFGDNSVSIDQVRLALSKISGSMDDAIDQDRGEY